MSEKLGLFQRIYKAMVSEQRFLEVRAQTKKWKAECKSSAAFSQLGTSEAYSGVIPTRMAL